MHTSPAPNAAESTAPITGVDDIRMILPEITDMVSMLSPVLGEVSYLAERSVSADPSHDDAPTTVNLSME